MKIAVAGPAGGYGGLEVHTDELAHFLTAKGHALLRLQVFPQRVGVRGKAEKLAFWAAACARIRAFQPDLLVAIGFGEGYSLLAKLSGGNCFRIQQIVTDDFRSRPDSLQPILASFDAIGAQTPTLKQAVAAAFESSPPVAVLPCFHQILANPSAPCSPPPVEEGIRLAYFGRLAGNKGLLLLLRAVAELASPALARLDIWGTGPVREELDSLIRAHPEIGARVSLKGRYPAGQDYIELLGSYHGLVLPSQACEGLPLVLLEAASVGLPILTTRIGGIVDFAGDNPDVVTMEVGLPALRQGLEEFVEQLQSDSFQRARQQAYFATHYSRTAIEESWSLMLQNPHRFFGIPGTLTPAIQLT
jgi:glycosyltransferase involved in cell wall biosynthesis